MTANHFFIFGSDGLTRGAKPKTEILTELNRHICMLLCNMCRYLQHLCLVSIETWWRYDGYDGIPTAKDTTHTHRSQGKVGKAVVVFRNMILNMRKYDFLLNRANTQSFWRYLRKSCNKATVVIDEDTDLVILLLFHANIEWEKIYFTSENNKEKGTGCMEY